MLHYRCKIRNQDKSRISFTSAKENNIYLASVGEILNTPNTTPPEIISCETFGNDALRT